MAPDLLRLWAKTVDAPPLPASVQSHPLVYHLLDVAAVARVLLRDSPDLARLARRLSASVDDLAGLLVFCCALHDIGKCSVHFQMRVPELWPGRIAPGFGPLPNRETIAPRPHGDITDLYLRASSFEGEEDPALLTPSFRGVLGNVSSRHEDKLIAAIAGHHGVPTSAGQTYLTGVAHKANAPFEAAARDIVAEIQRALGLPASPFRLALDDTGAAALSWRLSALLPVCDWVGSNQEWFPARQPDLDAEAYWRRVALPRARAALVKAGLRPATPAPPEPARTLRHLPDAKLTPVQQFAFDCPLSSLEPTLILIEDATGSGKTEAALALAHRLMAESNAAGFYLALPTMATANAMYGRLSEIYATLFVEREAPSLSLAHGKAERNEDFLRSLRQGSLRNGPGETETAAFCASWIGDSRRKALLAQAGAGTIDQALMAVLPLRYQSLRLQGLIGKTLILDEVHAFDPFMLRLIEALLELHAMLGGSAVLMSATLPLTTRQRLLAAFARGRGLAPSQAQAQAYPLVTTQCDGRLIETPLPLAAQSARRVRVERVASVAEAEDLALAFARRGAAVALLRSTVDATIASFKRLVADHAETELFHARFLLDDRLAIERGVLARFGKAGGNGERRGRILVASQVIEQSLDVDFDVLITDLAPIDLLIQRAGRLWRHARGARPVERPVLHVISPEPTDACGADWLELDLKEAKWVYGDAARLWLSARRLFEVGEIVTATLAEGEEDPAHVRRLVEAVYAAEPDDLPTDGLKRTLDQFIGKWMAEHQIAAHSALDPRQGYVRSGPWEAEARAVTRFEPNPRVNVRLARKEGGELLPLGADWSLSELRVSQTFAKGLEPPTKDQAKQLRPAWTEADEGVRILVLERNGIGWRSSESGFAYDGAHGLRKADEQDEDGG